MHGSSRLQRLVLLLLASMAVLAVLAVPTFARAEEKSHEVVRVGWYESPFNYADANGRRSGYAYEYQQKITAYTGWEYEYVEGSWPELLDKLKSGEIDLMSDVSYTDERAEEMLFSAYPMDAESYYVFVATSNTEIKLGDPLTLEGRTPTSTSPWSQTSCSASWLSSSSRPSTR